MDYWNTLVGNALMGTDRHSPHPPKPQASQPEDTLTTVLNQLDWQQSERSILAAAGIIPLYQQAGQLPVTTDWDALDPCAEETLSYCSHRTARHLDMVIEDYSAILPELLNLIATAQQCVPPRLLPKLLKVGQHRSNMRSQIATVIGQRGQWLARQNSDWAYGLVQETEFDSGASLWKEGSRSERALFLRQWRELDANAAREALEAIWSSELARDREALMASLACNLAMADEPFLEKARCDRAQAVRQQALKLLVQLPDSRLCQRMAKHMTPFVTTKTKFLTVTINVALPKTFDPEWEKDGITPRRLADLGEKASWLYQMISSTSLSHWPGDPAPMIQAIENHQWRDTLLKGWSVAACRQKNTKWAKILVDEFTRQDIHENLLPGLLALLSLEHQEEILSNRKPNTHKNSLHWLKQVGQCSQLWSLDFSYLVLQQIFTLVRNSDRKEYELHYLLKNLALVLHPSLAPTIAEKINQLPENTRQFNWIQDTLDEFYRLMNIRYEMHQAFNPSG